MPSPAKPKTQPKNVRWSPEELRAIQRAAVKLAAQHRVRTTASDVIRIGTMEFTQKILGAA